MDTRQFLKNWLLSYQRFRERARKKIKKHWRAAFSSLMLTTLLAFVFLLFLVGTLAGTFSQETIVNTSTTLLTVEGFMLGMSYLIEKKERRILPTFLGFLSVLASLLTIILAQDLEAIQAQSPGTKFPVNFPILFGLSLFHYFFIQLGLFLLMLESYFEVVAQGLRVGDELETEP